MEIKYLKLPIYSIAVYGQYIYFSGGGGGSTGIPNEIKIYHRQITSEPAHEFPTDTHIIQNMTVCEQRQIMVCNANDHLMVYRVLQNGKNLQFMYRMKADFKPQYPTINGICLSKDGSIAMAGGDDTVPKFYQLQEERAELIHQYQVHTQPIKNVDHNEGDLYLSCDGNLIAICNLAKKQIIRSVFNDQLQPSKTVLQAAYFHSPGGSELLMVHYLIKEKTFLTKETKGKFHTRQIADDQCCKSAFNKQQKRLGVACGRGVTTMYNTQKMKSLGSENKHKDVVLGCIITRKGWFISGTSGCSYHIQGPSESLQLNWSLPLTLLWTLIVIYLLGTYSPIQIEGDL